MSGSSFKHMYFELYIYIKWLFKLMHNIKYDSDWEFIPNSLSNFCVHTTKAPAFIQ